MGRFEAFEIYLKPEEKEQGQRSHKEMQFDQWMMMGACSSWLECERRWQQLYPGK